MGKTREIRIINGIDKLKCNKCGYWLPFEDFRVHNGVSTGRKSYCAKCEDEHYNKKRYTFNSSIKGMSKFICPYCQKEFMTKYNNKVYCSPKCCKRDWYEKSLR